MVDPLTFLERGGRLVINNGVGSRGSEAETVAAADKGRISSSNRGARPWSEGVLPRALGVLPVLLSTLWAVGQTTPKPQVKTVASTRPALSAAQAALRDKFLADGDAKFTSNNGYAALPLLLEAADLGSAAAQYDLGLIFAYGPWVRTDQEHALQLFEAAALGGDARAASFIGEFYANAKNGPVDLRSARFWYQRGYEARDARATLRLAEVSCNGMGARRDAAACGRLLDAASSYRNQQDRGDAVRDLGVDEAALGAMYASGKVAVRNLRLAGAWDAKAAALGNVPGAVQESALYVGNKGLGEDLVKAEAILDDLRKKSAADGPAVAKGYVAVGARYEERQPVDWQNASEVYLKAAHLGQLGPQIALGLRYANGTGVAKNPDTAYAVLQPLVGVSTKYADQEALAKALKVLAAAYQDLALASAGASATVASLARQRAAQLTQEAVVRMVPPAVAEGDAMAMMPPPPMTERYPNMSAPDSVPVGQTFAVDVSLDNVQLDAKTKIVTGNQDNGKLKITLPQGMTTMPIQVTLIAPGMTFPDGSNTATLTLDSTQDYSMPAQFNLQAGTAPGSGTLMAILTYHNNFLARLARPIAVTSATEAGTAVTPRTVGLDVPVQPNADTKLAVLPSPARPAAGTPAVVADPTQKDADLLITETADLKDDTLTYVINGSLGTQTQVVQQASVLRAAMGVVYGKLQTLSQLLVPGFKLTQCAGKITDPDILQACATIKNTRVTVQGLGDQLYSTQAPQIFRDLIIYMNANHLRLHTITVVTDSPTLPWELMWVPAADGTSNFLGLTAAVVRQTMSAPQATAPAQVPFAGIAVIAPKYGNASLDLQGAGKEVAMLTKDFSTVQSVEGNSAAVGALLEDPPQGIIHFTGHGQRDAIAGAVSAAPSGGAAAPAVVAAAPVAADPAAALAPNVAIALDDESMEPAAFTGYLKDGPQQSKAPFYFFNACDLGRIDPQLGYVSGWAPALMQSGASGFLGALYEVGDNTAVSFATHFYSELKTDLAGSDQTWTMADVVTDARRATYAEANDPTALAYVLYTKPFMRFIPAQP